MMSFDSCHDQEDVKPPRWFDDLSQAQKRVWSAAFSSLLDGRPLDVNPADEVVASLVQQGRIVLDDAGAIIAAAGISLLPTRYAITMDGRTLNVLCALDAVGIPTALGRRAAVTSACATCGRQLRFTLPDDVDLPAPRVWLCDDMVGRSFVDDT